MNIFHGGYTGQGEVLDFSANINPLAPPGFIKPLLDECTDTIYRYPDWTYKKLREAMSSLYKTPVKTVYPSNGASHGIVTVLNAVRPRTLILPVPTYGDYEAYTESLGVELRRIPYVEEGDEYKLDWDAIAMESQRTEPPGVIALSIPNNPTGTLVSPMEIEHLSNNLPRGITVLVDESYLDLALGEPAVPIGGKPGIISVRSLTKELGVPGLRLGFTVADEIISGKLWAMGGSWQVNSLAECVLRRMWESYREDYARFLSRSHGFIEEERTRLTRRLEKLGYKVYRSHGNFLLIKHPWITSVELVEKLLSRGIYVRRGDTFTGLTPHHTRIAVRRKWENDRLVEALEEYSQTA